MTEEEKKGYRERLFQLRLKQALYTMEHKVNSHEIDESITQLKHEYMTRLIEDKEGEKNYVEHKRK